VAVSLLVGHTFGEEPVGDNAGQDLAEETLSKDQLRALHGNFDANKDGKVSLQEVLEFSKHMGLKIAQKDVTALLEEIDTSKDGKLHLDEHLNDIRKQAEGGDAEEEKELAHRLKTEDMKFKAADTNGDGLLDPEEVPSLFYPEVHDGVLSIVVAETMRNKDINGDGKLTQKEFWEITEAEGDEAELSEEENADFARLDFDQDGGLNMEELKAWESGQFHIVEAMKKMFELADANADMHLGADELAAASEQLGASDAQYHLIEWAEHNEL
jgi:calcium-binding protein CML